MALAATPMAFKRVTPVNLAEQEALFFQTGCKVAPQFRYDEPVSTVERLAAENSYVDTSLRKESESILRRTLFQHGGETAYLAKVYGEDYLNPTELRDFVLAYLQEFDIPPGCVSVQIINAPSLTIASVVREGARKYVVRVHSHTNNNVNNGSSVRPSATSDGRGQGIPRGLAQCVCDHEIGTHLLRFLNEDDQEWARRREEYNLRKDYCLQTEEGLASLNTLVSCSSKLLCRQALAYYAVCLGAELGFVDLYEALRPFSEDSVARFRLCARVKRGMTDTAVRGAFTALQSYFLGTVEILRRLDEIPDLTVFYAGKLSLSELERVYWKCDWARSLRLPKFFKGDQAIQQWREHCKAIIKENDLEDVCSVPSARKLFSRWWNRGSFPCPPLVRATTEVTRLGQCSTAPLGSARLPDGAVKKHIATQEGFDNSGVKSSSSDQRSVLSAATASSLPGVVSIAREVQNSTPAKSWICNGGGERTAPRRNISSSASRRGSTSRGASRSSTPMRPNSSTEGQRKKLSVPEVARHFHVPAASASTFDRIKARKAQYEMAVNSDNPFQALKIFHERWQASGTSFA